VTGFGTSLSDVMNASDFSHAVVSTEPLICESLGAPRGRHASIVAWRIASCVARSLPRSVSALIAASTPIDGVVAISFIALSVAPTNPATASFFAAIVAVLAMIPGPGSGVASSTRRTLTYVPVSASWSGWLFK
jgi:hypothetical protein